MSPMPADLPPVAPAIPTALHGPASTGPEAWRPYPVQEGDTLYDLAREHNTSVAALVKRNGLRHGGRWLMPGALIEVPGGEPPAEPRPVAATATAPARTVTVRAGETLSHLSVRYDVPVAAILQANGLRDARMIHPGQRLTVPVNGPAAAPLAEPRGTQLPSTTSEVTPSRASTTVTVRPGDTLSHIAARHDVPLSALRRSNGELDPQRLWVGQQVTVPGDGSGATPTAKPAGRPAGAFRPENIGAAKEGEEVPETFLHYTYSSAVSRSAAANREFLAKAPMPSRAEVKQLVVDTATAHGVDPRLMLALSSQESGWNQRAVSPANAIGVMQVIPSSGDWASALVGRELNLLDSQDNVTAGTVIMRSLLRAAKDEDEAIAGYYQGLAGVQEHGMYADTEHYVRAIQALRARP